MAPRRGNVAAKMALRKGVELNDIEPLKGLYLEYKKVEKIFELKYN